MPSSSTPFDINASPDDSLEEQTVMFSSDSDAAAPNIIHSADSSLSQEGSSTGTSTVATAVPNPSVETGHSELKHSLVDELEAPSATVTESSPQTQPLSVAPSAQPAITSFKAQVMSWAIAVGMLPILAVGTVTYFSGQTVQQQVSQSGQTAEQKLAATRQQIQQQLPTLLIGTGITAVLTGAIAAWLAYRTTTPVLKAASVSSDMLQKIRPGVVKQGEETNVLNQLERNIRDIEDYLPALLAQQDAEIEQLQMLKYITNKIRTSLNEDDVLNTTVEEARKILKADRVMVYGFDDDWYGTVIAESVIPGLPKALWAEIRDPCFAERYVEKYQAGRVQAVNNVYEAGLTECHLSQLEPFQVKANLVVPILREQKLFGLLIAHQCTQPRVWQDVEINFFAQVASQVGFALDHSRLMVQVDQASQSMRTQSQKAVQEYEVLQQQVSQLSIDSNGVVELFGSEANQAITQTQDQMHEIAETADQIHLILNEINQMHQAAQLNVQESQKGMEETVNHISTLHQLVGSIDEVVHPLHQPSQQLGELVDLMGHIVSQVQLQAMNAALEAARAGTAGQSFAQIAEKVHGLSRQLDATLTDVKPLISHIQSTTQTVATNMADHKTTLLADTQTLGNTQEHLQHLHGAHQRVLDLVQQIAEVTTNQVELSVSGHKTLDHLAQTLLQATEQSSHIADAIHQLRTTDSSVEPTDDTLVS